MSSPHTCEWKRSAAGSHVIWTFWEFIVGLSLLWIAALKLHFLHVASTCSCRHSRTSSLTPPSLSMCLLPVKLSPQSHTSPTPRISKVGTDWSAHKRQLHDKWCPRWTLLGRSLYFRTKILTRRRKTISIFIYRRCVEDCCKLLNNYVLLYCTFHPTSPNCMFVCGC